MPNEFQRFSWNFHIGICNTKFEKLQFRIGGLKKGTGQKNRCPVAGEPKGVLAWDFLNSYKLWSPRWARSTKKSARYGRQSAILDFCNTSRTRTRLQKLTHIQMVFRWFSKVRKFQFIFWTPLAFWASHFSILQNWRPPNLTYTVVLWIVTTGVREVFKKSEFVLWRPRRSFYFRRPVRTGVHFVTCNENPWARIEVLMRSKSWNGKKNDAPTWVWRIAILKIVSAAKLLKFYSDSHSVWKRRKWWWQIWCPRWKTWTPITLLAMRRWKKRFSLGRCWKNQECVLACARQQEKKTSAIMRGSADSCFFRKSPAGTIKMQ